MKLTLELDYTLTNEATTRLFLARSSAVRICLALPEQVLSQPIQADPHDQSVDYIVTRDEILKCHNY
jgi:5-formyltetrahydrofolate cyclo-ligase